MSTPWPAISQQREKIDSDFQYKNTRDVPVAKLIGNTPQILLHCSRHRPESQLQNVVEKMLLNALHAGFATDATWSETAHARCFCLISPTFNSLVSKIPDTIPRLPRLASNRNAFQVFMQHLYRVRALLQPCKTAVSSGTPLGCCQSQLWRITSDSNVVRNLQTCSRGCGNRSQACADKNKSMECTRNCKRMSNWTLRDPSIDAVDI